jgi:hypothetical protein
VSRVKEWWRGLGTGARIAVVVVAVIVGGNVAVEVLEEVTGGAEPSGPPSSSYATAPHGLAAYAELLADNGHRVERLRRPLDEVAIPPDATLVLADVGPLAAGDVEAVAAWLALGGRLVVTGESAAPIVESLRLGPVEWSPFGDSRSRPIVPLDELEGVSTVASAGSGGWVSTGPLLPTVAGGRAHLLATAVLGRGRVLALADASPVQNRLLAAGDNAAFGLAVAGPPRRPVLFAEHAHGYGTGTGLGALPSDWKWAGLLASVAALAWMWSRGRRLGPPELAERPLPPARRGYVDALAAGLAKSRRRGEAIEPVRARGRALLARRLGLPAGAGDGELQRGAGELGLPAGETAALLGRGGTDADVLAAGRAMARLEGGRR